MMKKKTGFSLIFLFLLTFCSHEEYNSKPFNIILMIGDGMGLGHVSANILINGSMIVEKMPYTGLIKTYSASHKVTDSGAAATAYSTGKKTYNGAIGVNRDSLPEKTILEIAENHGLATGLVATSSITHATPASFIAHQKDRNLYEAIASDFLKTDIDIFIGGGSANFSNRKDGLDLLKDLRSKGYSVINDTTELKSAEGKIAALLADEHLPKSPDRGNVLSLSVEKALSVLSGNKKGFFLMIEGSQIDWASHNNDSAYLISELADFDKAIEKALNFAIKDKNTLVIVTADHETGGVVLKQNENKAEQINVVFTSVNHTSAFVPVYAFGPGAEKFSGIYENTALFDKMSELFNFKSE